MMLPGSSSAHVSRQLMPRMWPSPSPRILLCTPWIMSVRSLNAARGSRMDLKLSAPAASGQNSSGSVPFGTWPASFGGVVRFAVRYSIFASR